MSLGPGGTYRERRAWIEGGDWGGDADDDADVIAECRTIELGCEVGIIIYRPEEPTIRAETRSDAIWDDGCWQVAVPAADAAALATQITAETGGTWATAETDADGDTWLRWTPPADHPVEVDEEATRLADMTDCSGTYSTPEPDCPVDEGWDWVSVESAGLDVCDCRSHGGTGMTHYEVCRSSGVYRETYAPGCQRNPGEALRTVTYRERDADSEAYIVECHTDDDGYIPEWLAEYLDCSLSTRMDRDAAREWVEAHDDDDDLDEDELEHAYAATMGHRADSRERSQGLWSLLCVEYGGGT